MLNYSSKNPVHRRRRFNRLLIVTTDFLFFIISLFYCSFLDFITLTIKFVWKFKFYKIQTKFVFMAKFSFIREPLRWFENSSLNQKLKNHDILKNFLNFHYLKNQFFMWELKIYEYVMSSKLRLLQKSNEIEIIFLVLFQICLKNC